MDKIEIDKGFSVRLSGKVFINYYFHINHEEINKMYSEGRMIYCCYYRKQMLFTVYSDIINSLKEKNLLPDDFVPMCCGCYGGKPSD